MRKFSVSRMGMCGLVLGFFTTVAAAGNIVRFTERVKLPFEIDEYGDVECREHDHDKMEGGNGGPPDYGIAKICFNTRTDRLRVLVRAYILNEYRKRVRLRNDAEVEACIEDEIAREIHHYTHGGGHDEPHVAALHDDGEEGHDDHDGKGRTTVDIARSLLKVTRLGRLKFSAKGSVTIGERGPGGGGGHGGGGGEHDQ